MRIGRIGADDDDHVRLLDTVEVLGTRRRAEGLAKAVAGRRVADPRAGIGVVVAEDRAGELLHEICFLVRAAAGGENADRVAPMNLLYSPELAGGEGQCLVPFDLAPWLVDPLADHRLQDTLLVVRIAIGEAPLDAGMAMIGLA